MCTLVLLQCIDYLCVPWCSSSALIAYVYPSAPPAPALITYVYPGAPPAPALITYVYPGAPPVQ